MKHYRTISTALLQHVKALITKGISRLLLVKNIMFNRDKLRNTSNVSVSKHNIFYRNNEGCWANDGAELRSKMSKVLCENLKCFSEMYF